MTRSWMAVGALALAALLGAGCGDSDDDGSGGGGAPGAGGDVSGLDGAALVGPFEEAAESAYEARGGDRAEDFTQGVVIEDGCFALTGEGAAAVAEALGVEGAGDAVVAGGTFLQGPPGQREVLTCGIDVGDGPRIGLGAGTVLLDRDELLEELELYANRDDGELAVIDGEAPGLDPADVLAVDRDGVATFSWVQGDFQIGLSVPDELADHDAGFRALPVAVSAVGDALSGG